MIQSRNTKPGRNNGNTRNALRGVAGKLARPDERKIARKGKGTKMIKAIEFYNVWQYLDEDFIQIIKSGSGYKAARLLVDQAKMQVRSDPNDAAKMSRWLLMDAISMVLHPSLKAEEYFVEKFPRAVATLRYPLWNENRQFGDVISLDDAVAEDATRAAYEDQIKNSLAVIAATK